MTNRTQVKLGLFAGVSALALASMAGAQAQQAAAPATEEVVVTGSRLGQLSA